MAYQRHDWDKHTWAKGQKHIENSLTQMDEAIDKNRVSVSEEGTATDNVKYITINDVEHRISGSGGSCVSVKFIPSEVVVIREEPDNRAKIIITPNEEHLEQFLEENNSMFKLDLTDIEDVEEVFPSKITWAIRSCESTVDEKRCYLFDAPTTNLAPFDNLNESIYSAGKVVLVMFVEGSLEYKNKIYVHSIDNSYVNFRYSELNGSVLQKPMETSFTFENPYVIRPEAVAVEAHGNYSIAFGGASRTENSHAIAEGLHTIAAGYGSHAEGNFTYAGDQFTHSEGQLTAALGYNSHAEGYKTKASGNFAHSEGKETQATGETAHAEGRETKASGAHSHAEGWGSVASGEDAHAEGYFTIADDVAETAVGQFNLPKSSFGSAYHVLFAVGDGSGEDARHNAFTVLNGGTAYLGDPVINNLVVTYSYLNNKLDKIDPKGSGTLNMTSTTNISGTSHAIFGEGHTQVSGNYNVVAGGGHTISSGNISNVVTGATNTITGMNGNYSFLSGNHNTISGNAENILVSGYQNNVYAWGSGEGQKANNIIMSGEFSQAYGNNKILVGAHLASNQGNNTAVFGHWNSYTDTDNILLNIGNGTSSSRSSAFIVLEDGSVRAGRGTTDWDDTYTLATKSYVDSKSSGTYWGNISGDITKQNDLWNELTAKSTATNVQNGGAGLRSIQQICDPTHGWVDYQNGRDADQPSGTPPAEARADYAASFNGHSCASGTYTTAFGLNTWSRGYGSFTLGNCTGASGDFAVAEGQQTFAYGAMSHAEGQFTLASGVMSHSEGQWTTAAGAQSHAQGCYTEANGAQSHAGGYYTIAGYENQTVIGRYNENKSTTLFEVGNGSSDARSNAFEVYADGAIRAAKLTDGTTTKTMTEVLSGGGALDEKLQYIVNNLTLEQVQTLVAFVKDLSRE